MDKQVYRDMLRLVSEAEIAAQKALNFAKAKGLPDPTFDIPGMVHDPDWSNWDSSVEEDWDNSSC